MTGDGTMAKQAVVIVHDVPQAVRQIEDMAAFTRRTLAGMTAQAHAVRARPLREEARRGLTLWEMLGWCYREQHAHTMLWNDRDWFDYLVALAAPTDDTARPKVHPDAAALHAEVERLGEDLARLVRGCALRAEVPELCTAQPVPMPVEPDRRSDQYYSWSLIGGVRIDYKMTRVESCAIFTPVYERQGRKGLVQIGTETAVFDILQCPISWWPDPDYVSMCKGIFDDFNEAMATLRGRLKGVRFRLHEISDLDSMGHVP